MISSELDVDVNPDKGHRMTNMADAKNRSAPPRRRLDPVQSKEIILDATEQLMLREGYAAISHRRVASEAGLKTPLVHYYYRTLDDLLLAFYQRSAARGRRQLEAALASARPLRALWDMICDPERTTLAAEFISLANHRKIIRAEIAKNVEAARASQVKMLAHALATKGLAGKCADPAVAAVLLASIGYGLGLENQVGVDTGHEATRAFVSKLIENIEG